MHEGKKLLERTSSSRLGQTAASGEKAAAGQGKIQWLVVVVVAARETARLTWLVLLTVDSLSSVDLTSQGFLYITAYACVHLCVGACMHAPKKKKEEEVYVFM